MKLLNNKYARIGAGVIFLLLLIFSVVPNLYRFGSSDGVVNAKTTTLASPIEGVLRLESKTGYGKAFEDGELIGRVLNDRVNKSFLFELQTEKKTLESRLKSFSERLDKYTALKESLEKNVENYRKYSAKQYEALITEQEHLLKAEQAEYERARKEYEANKGLIAKGSIDKRLLERTESNFLKSSQRVESIKSKIVENKNLLEAVIHNTFLGEGHNDSPYSKQRMDQMVIEIALAETTVEETESRIAGIEEQIKNEKERIKKAESFTIISPFDSLVWKQPTTEGSNVAINSELLVLLDCSSVFLDVALSESQFANIGAGDKIKYRLIGNVGYKQGTVFALRGSGTEADDKNLAAKLEMDPKKDFRIWVQADPADLDLDPENFYQVGRRVEVRIPRAWRVSRFFRRIFDVF